MSEPAHRLSPAAADGARIPIEVPSEHHEGVVIRLSDLRFLWDKMDKREEPPTWEKVVLGRIRRVIDGPESGASQDTGGR